MNIRNKNVRLFAGVMAVLLLAGCGGSKSDMSYYSNTEAMYEGAYDNGYYDMYEEEAPYEMSSSSKPSESQTIDTSRKLIKDYSIDVETENFDSLMPAIETRVKELGGYIESLNTYYGGSYRYSSRSSSLKIRIPKDKDEEFIKFVGNSANLVRQNLNVSDVTLKYVDMASRRDSYIVERDRLLKLLEDAENIDTILIIEERLSEVRYNLESMESQLRTMDNLVDYSTISLSVEEVKQYTEPEPETYWQRIKSSFHDGIEDFINVIQSSTIWLVGAFPILLLYAAVITVIVLLIKKIKKSSAKRALKKEIKKAEKAAKKAESDNSGDGE